MIDLGEYSEKVRFALKFADAFHGDQKYGIFPYSKHLKDTVNEAISHNFSEEVQIVCALHDILEDTPIPTRTLIDVFGDRITEFVYLVTDEKGFSRKERKRLVYQKIIQSEVSIAVKLCDRLANVKNSKTYSPKKFEMYVYEGKYFEEMLRKAEFKMLPMFEQMFLELKELYN